MFISGAGENILRCLALFVYLDYPAKNDVTSGKKAGGAAKPNERYERSTKEVLFLYQSYKCIEKGNG